jgi:biliverdin reductase / flavin reductase
MRLVVFGASGKCGAHLVRLAAQRGHDVTAMVRPSTRYAAPAGRVSVSRGDVLDADFVAAQVAGHDAVASGLGIRYRHPWAKRESPDDFISRATGHIVAGMKRHGIGRLCVISAGGVGDSRPALNLVIRFFLATSNVGVAYADLERVETILRESGLDWLAVRPTTLSNRAARGSRLTDRYPATASISREDVAAFLLGELERPQFTSRTPMITSAGM